MLSFKFVSNANMLVSEVRVPAAGEAEVQASKPVTRLPLYAHTRSLSSNDMDSDEPT